MSDLNGATSAPPPDARPGTPGEFAASWNDRTEDQREELLQALISNTEEASRCFMADHVGRLGALERRTTSAEAIVTRVQNWADQMSVQIPIDARHALHRILTGVTE